MATRYVHRCPNQAYAITLEMCRARHARKDSRCRHCRAKPCLAKRPV